MFSEFLKNRKKESKKYIKFGPSTVYIAHF